MIVVIDGKRFDTDKAKRTWSLAYHNDSNMFYGSLYLSSKGTWYCLIPTQWANDSRWVIVNPAEAIELYGRGLSEAEIADILQTAGLETE